jgi:hypothetical protein
MTTLYDINMIAVGTVTNKGKYKASTLRVNRATVTLPNPQMMVTAGISQRVAVDDIHGNVGDSTSRLKVSTCGKRPCHTGLPPKNNKNTLLSDLQFL